MFGLFNFNDPSRSQFEANYRVYPVTFLDKPEAEAGDKIFLPPSALDRLGALDLLRTGAVDEQAGLAFHSLAVERQSIETPQYWHPSLIKFKTFSFLDVVCYLCMPRSDSLPPHRLPDALQVGEQGHRQDNALWCA
jgi:hypothetical protein